MVTGGRIIGLIGYARTGKDTAASALANDGWVISRFSEALKEAAYRSNPQIVQNGITYRLAGLVDAYGWERVKDDFDAARPFLQDMGKAMRDVVSPSVWVDTALARIPAGRNAVFTDVRYRNEADAILAAGGILVRITRPGVGPAVGPDGKVHVSEVDLDGYLVDAVIENRGTRADLCTTAVMTGVSYDMYLEWRQPTT